MPTIRVHTDIESMMWALEEFFLSMRGVNIAVGERASWPGAFRDTGPIRATEQKPGLRRIPPFIAPVIRAPPGGRDKVTGGCPSTRCA